jgi:hypothetical protein
MYSQHHIDQANQSVQNDLMYVNSRTSYRKSDVRECSVGRPQARWSDDLRRTAGRSWMRVAEDRARWRDIGDAYVQQWTVVG